MYFAYSTFHIICIIGLLLVYALVIHVMSCTCMEHRPEHMRTCFHKGGVCDTLGNSGFSGELCHLRNKVNLT